MSFSLFPKAKWRHGQCLGIFIEQHLTVRHTPLYSILHVTSHIHYKVFLCKIISSALAACDLQQTLYCLITDHNSEKGLGHGTSGQHSQLRLRPPPGCDTRGSRAQVWGGGSAPSLPGSMARSPCQGRAEHPGPLRYHLPQIHAARRSHHKQRML